jgi:hypothetical protein
MAIEVQNTGNKELEDLVCRIGFHDAKLSEYKITGIPLSAVKVTPQESQFELQADFINPKEVISIQLLFALASAKFDEPKIEIRGKGQVGERKPSKVVGRKEEPFTAVFGTAIIALTSVVLGLATVRKYRPQIFYTYTYTYTKSHRGDQRDILAYIFSINGFNDEANLMRTSNRPLMYWSQADFLTERCLAAGDKAIVRRGIKVLEDLLYYAEVVDTSQLLINFDIARMAAAIGDIEKVKKHIELARKGNHKVIEKRIQLDENLSKILSQV